MHYNKTKGGVDSHDLKFALFTTARKTNSWPMRLFHGMLDSFIVDAYVILLANSVSDQHIPPIAKIKECIL